jgi:hypothetical protein
MLVVATFDGGGGKELITTPAAEVQGPQGRDL